MTLKTTVGWLQSSSSVFAGTVWCPLSRMMAISKESCEWWRSVYAPHNGSKGEIQPLLQGEISGEYFYDSTTSPDFTHRSPRTSPHLFMRLVTVSMWWYHSHSCRRVDCGLFAIATATSLCFGIPPSTVLWDQKKIREHLRRCFENGKMSPFPGRDLPDRRKITPHISDEPLFTTVKVEVYCSCKMPQVGRERMAQCTECLKWYHERCENIPKTVFCKSKRTPYSCKYC